MLRLFVIIIIKKRNCQQNAQKIYVLVRRVPIVFMTEMSVRIIQFTKFCIVLYWKTHNNSRCALHKRQHVRQTQTRHIRTPQKSRRHWRDVSISTSASDITMNGGPAPQSRLQDHYCTAALFLAKHPDSRSRFVKRKFVPRVASACVVMN